MTSPVDLRELAIDRSETAGRPRVGERRHMLTRYVLPTTLILGFLSLVAWASWEFVFPPKAVTVTPVIASTADVQREGAPLFNAAGWIEPRPTPIRVAALAPGVVEKLLVVEDQPVQAGDPIATLVADDAKLAHERSLAELKLREAELEDAGSQLKAAKTRLEHPVHLEAALHEAEAALAQVDTLLTNLPFQRQRAVADQAATRRDYEGKAASRGVVAGVEIEIAKSKLESADALVRELGDREISLKKERKTLSQRREALQTQLELLADETKAVESATALVKAAEARLEQSRVVVAEAKLQLDRMTISAPVDGRIFRLIAHPGARIGGGMTQMIKHDGSTVVTMYRPDSLQIRVDVRFEDIPKVTLGQPVEIDNPALSSPLIGKTLFVSSEADIQKNTLQVKVAILDPPSLFKPEMLVDVTFLAPERPNRDEEPSQELKLYVPRQLVEQEQRGSFVWVADQSAGVARKALIEVDTSKSSPLVHVTSGLTTTSRLIVGGRDGLNDGQRIEVTGEDAAPDMISPGRNESGVNPTAGASPIKEDE